MIPSHESEVSRPVLEMQNISKSFSGVSVLQDVQLKVMPGEVHALMGENGAGKSTLMNILMGIHAADSGQILLNGKPITNRTPHEAMGNGISMIHQELHPVMDMEVSENIFLGRELKTGTDGIFGLVKRKQMRRETEEIFQRMGISISPSALMRSLSVAQCQLVEIVKAISISSRVIIMDEPTSAITEKEVDILFRQIRALREDGVSIIYISHKMDEIFQIADSITVLRDGRYIGSERASKLDRNTLIQMMVGREITEIFPKTPVETGPVVMEVRNYTWGRKVRNISFSLRKGEILGIAGLVGAGRSELAETLFGIHSHFSGELLISGQKVSIRRPEDAIKHKMALVTEDRKLTGLNLVASIEQNITLVSLDQLFPGGIINKKTEARAAEESIQKLNVAAASRQMPARSLSGGNQQKVVIAKWLLSQPDIIIMDEPTRGIDVGAKRDIYLLLGELAQAGKSIIMISSEIQEIMGIADRIIVMAEGRITGELQREQFSQQQIMHYASQFSKRNVSKGNEDGEN